MSVKVMGKVWDTDLPGNLKIVLLAYADAAEHDGTEIWPGRGRIALMCGIAVSTADRLTRELVKVGYLVQVAKGHRGQRAAYEIPLDRLAVAYQSDTQSETDSLSTESESLLPDAGKPIAPDSTPVPDPSLPSVLKTAATPLPPDEDYMDLLVDIYGKPLHWSQYQDIVNHIKAHNGYPDDIPRKSALLTAEWGAAKATPASLKKWWTRYDAQISQVSDADVEAFTAAGDREAMLERLADE